MTSNDEQILKCRDDKEPVCLLKIDEQSGQAYKLADKSQCSWLEHGKAIDTVKLRQRIEPWLTALFQAEHLALLVGSGFSNAIHWMATGKEPPWTNIQCKFTYYQNEIEAEVKRSAYAAGRGKGNVEDQIRVANELLRGLEILKPGDHEVVGLREDLNRFLTDFAESILKGERGLISAESDKLKKSEQAFTYLVSFLMSFASRTGTRDRLHIFTTNYDRFIEAGADVAGLHLLDRFVGSLAPVFRSSRLDLDMHYNPPGIRGEPRYLEGVARFTKLHGSLDWVDIERNIRRIAVPFGAQDIKPYLDALGLSGAKAIQLMIYPNAAKDRETAAYPYVELFRDFAAAVCRPNSTLVTFGYSFGDEHINRVIEDMLTIPSAHLVVISYSDPLGRIMKTYERLGRHAQITLLIGNHFGDLQSLVDNYLPKPAIDRATFRMVELLKARWVTDYNEPAVDSNILHGEGDGKP
ncbi:SIR2 family protein [Desulfofundulus thermosubterraneus]|uniref:SIR2-like domain-containing protein n=1 Tax=Desulfofundulus thermosubterraneus DSM 16057 TaxID=1121432 RepID=A0A1M6E460_9FIRM|nr:SIR2 family protein [Desulfofundulus thermosubterraneus]SHI80324.1 SIR2-like domain-containing protein [Desulfofundulus thermosubterraneus DSM 16057]